MDRYTARINAVGENARERCINRLRNEINNKAQHNPSYKTIRLNGVETNLIIDSGTKPYYKQFKSLPGQEINIGDYIEWSNSNWLVTDCDFDDEIYRDGTLTQCNYLLKWQNESGKIIERWAVISSASRYNDGTEGSKVIVLGSDQLSVVVPVDEETIKLKKSMSKKFFIDNNMTNPTTYELTGTGNVEDTYNGHGVTSWIVSECAYNATEDDLQYGVCDYFSPTTPVDPPSHETAVLSAKITGNVKLKVGFLREFTVNFTNSEGKIVDNQNFTWNVVSDFPVTQIVNCQSIKLRVDDEDYIDYHFLLQVIVGGSVLTEQKITVVDIF